MKIFPLHAADFYKTGHIRMFPEGTEFIGFNFTPRSDKLAKLLPDFDRKVVFFGLQGVIRWLLIDMWNEEFFRKPKDRVVARFKRRMDRSLGPGAVGTEHIEALHDLGYLPLLIKALPEGSRVNIRVPVFTVENTVKGFGWVAGYVETQLSAECWKPITTATIAYEYRRLLEDYAERTGSPKEFVQWQGHDFSMRGMSGIHDAAKSGGGHLLSFTGTDTIAAIDYLEDYYLEDGGLIGSPLQAVDVDAEEEEEFIGGSVPATEHAVMCMGGVEDEIETFRRIIEDLYPSGPVSVVSDTWNLWTVLTEYAPALKSVIEARRPDAFGVAKVVFRPDSGDPVKIICGSADVINIEAEDLEGAKQEAVDLLSDRVAQETPHGEPGETEPEGYFRFNGQIFLAKVSIEWNRHDKQFYYQDGASLLSFEPVELTPAEKGAAECLWEVFGGTITKTGHKLLNPRVGLIYGDAITLDRASKILAGLEAKGFASGNIVFGIGSFTYQFITRDTFGQAYKATWGIVNGEFRELFKEPVTDSGTKHSARGRVRVEKVGSDFFLHDRQTLEQANSGELRTVFLNGDVDSVEGLSTIRARLLG